MLDAAPRGAERWLARHEPSGKQDADNSKKKWPPDWVQGDDDSRVERNEQLMSWHPP
jgi:hypothetical protein